MFSFFYVGTGGSDLYSGLVKVFSDVQGIQVAVGSHVFDLTLVGLNLFENYLPTRCVVCSLCVVWGAGVVRELWFDG